jgi:hypothetical protein
MRINLNGFMRNITIPQYKEMVVEFLSNVKELRDNPSKHNEFFDLYVFSDDKEYRAAKEQKTTDNRSDEIAFLERLAFSIDGDRKFLLDSIKDRIAQLRGKR